MDAIFMEILLVMTVLGVVFGAILGIANKKFRMDVNPLIHMVEDVLPKGQCGACGYAGCMAYAEAVVLKPEVAPNLCIPGKDEVAQLVAELTGKKAEAIEPHVAHIQCAGTKQYSKINYKYDGVADCVAANTLFGGDKACHNGCLGMGSCVKACPFDALSLGENGMPLVDEMKCVACGKCQAVCPKKTIVLIPKASKVMMNCSCTSKGMAVKTNCTVGCISCTICVRQCPHGAIAMVNNLPRIDHKKCADCTDPVCTIKCPTHAITVYLK